MKKFRLIPAFLLSAALLSGLIGCKKETEYYNPNSQTSQSVTETQTLESTEGSTEASTEESTEEPTEASTEESTEGSTEESTAAPVISKELAVGDIWYVNADSLNIRDYPSTEGNKLGTLYRGEEVRILALAENGWVQIHSTTMDGYVKADFLVSSPEQVGDAAADAAASAVPASDENTANANTTSTNGHIVCIDAGHQQAGISEQEPNGPGSSVMKAKLTTGTSGIATGLAEYQLNLDVSQMLQQELLNRGYQVIMIRTTNDCPMSNAERAVYANESGAEIFVRIHANSSDDPSVNGAMFYAPSAANPYLSADVISASNTLASTMLSFYCSTTGLANKGLLQDDSMTGINWCTIPVTIVEMGFMSNPEEDQKMANPEFQAVIAQGLANGIDAYFGR